MSLKPEQIILLDADVVSHFISGGLFGILPQIFPLRLCIMDVVVKELLATVKFRNYIQNVISRGVIKEITFGGDKQVMMEYARLIRQFGKGESASMAYCRYHHDVLASSNLKDISSYCQINKIPYITTMDFLAEAYNREMITEEECNSFIRDVKSAGSKLPVNTIAEYYTQYSPRTIIVSSK